MISSRLADGVSFNTAVTTFITFALVNPSIIRAAAASSVAGFVDELTSEGESVPLPFTTLSLSSRISL